MNTYYPLTIGNAGYYRMKDGVSYSNLVQDRHGESFIMVNSMTNIASTIVKEGDAF